MQSLDASLTPRQQYERALWQRVRLEQQVHAAQADAIASLEAFPRVIALWRGIEEICAAVARAIAAWSHAGAIEREYALIERTVRELSELVGVFQPDGVDHAIIQAVRQQQRNLGRGVFPFEVQGWLDDPFDEATIRRRMSKLALHGYLSRIGLKNSRQGYETPDRALRTA